MDVLNRGGGVDLKMQCAISCFHTDGVMHILIQDSKEGGQARVRDLTRFISCVGEFDHWYRPVGRGI